jgi:hypothetical protein
MVEMDVKNPADPMVLATANCGYWAILNKIKLGSNIFTFDDHPYQIEPMESDARRVCVMKGTQGGFTEVEVLKSLHGMIFGHYPQGVLYLFPTSDDVGEFSKARFGPLITANKESIGKYVKTGGKGTDTTSLKKVADAFLYLRGARLTQTVGDETASESPKLRSIPVDKVVFDEVDLMDEDVQAKALARMGHSKVKEEVYISNPTIPDFGIDKVFQQSDQRHWFRKCESCNEWTCAELEFPNCVKLNDAGRGFVACKKCGHPLGLGMIDVSGEWVRAKPDNKDIIGYRWSQLSSAFVDPWDILTAFNDPPQGNLADVYRLMLGLPYIAAEDRLRINDVYACCGQDIVQTGHAGPCAMGVDVGKIKHVVIGIRTDRERFEILKVAALSNFGDIHDLARRFNVKSAVIDIRPYEDEARRFQKEEGYKIFLCEYGENMVSPVAFNENTKTVRAGRTEVFDATHRLIVNKLIRLPRQCPDMDIFAQQLCATAKVLETNKKSGTAIYRYKKLGDEHYRNALNYFYIAASGHRVSTVNSAFRNLERFVKHETVKL